MLAKVKSFYKTIVLLFKIAGMIKAAARKGKKGPAYAYSKLGKSIVKHFM